MIAERTIVEVSCGDDRFDVEMIPQPHSFEIVVTHSQDGRSRTGFVAITADAQEMLMATLECIGRQIGDILFDAGGQQHRSLH